MDDIKRASLDANPGPIDAELFRLRCELWERVRGSVDDALREMVRRELERTRFVQSNGADDLADK